MQRVILQNLVPVHPGFATATSMSPGQSRAQPSSAQLSWGQGDRQSQGGSGRAMAPVGYWPQGEPG